MAEQEAGYGDFRSWSFFHFVCFLNKVWARVNIFQNVLIQPESKHSSECFNSATLNCDPRARKWQKKKKLPLFQIFLQPRHPLIKIIVWIIELVKHYVWAWNSFENCYSLLLLVSFPSIALSTHCFLFLKFMHLGLEFSLISFCVQFFVPNIPEFLLEEVCGLYNPFTNIAIWNILVIIFLISVLRHYERVWLSGSAGQAVSESYGFNS